MDMVIFRMIFVELFSFLHVHVPYYPFRLLTNLRNTPRRDETLLFVWPIDNSTGKLKTTVINCPKTPLWTPNPPPSHPWEPTRE